MFNQRRVIRRIGASPLVAACAAILVALALVVPALAVEGPTKLFDVTVSPRTGSTTTTITFTVMYRNREGSPADHVRVLIDGSAHAMASDGTTDWHDGVAHHWSTKLAAGTHAISFEAADTRKFSDTIDGGSVTIGAPPTPTPTPKPTPKPEPTSTPAPTPDEGGGADPTPRPAPDDSAGGPGDSGSPAGGATTPDSGAPGPDDPLPGGSTDGSTGSGGTGDLGDGGIGGIPGDVPLPSSDTGRTGGPADDAGRHAGWIGWVAPGAGSPPFDPTSGTGGPGTPDDRNGPTSPGGDDVATDTTNGSAFSGGPGGGSRGGPGWGALAAALETLGIQRPLSVTVLPMLVGTTSAASMAFAFAIFGKKRRNEAQPAPDEVLGENAARGVPAVPGAEVANGVVASVAVPAPVDVEAAMPRWRRPSLQAARKADPARSVGISQPMTFEQGVAHAIEGRERRLIRYAVVRLLDAPDELRSSEIGQLDQNDEVQLIERSGTYWLVLCPNGQQGWIHKMTLGEVVTDGPPAFAREVDDDVLAAFLTARARA